MNQLPEWLKIASPFVGSLLAVSVAALSAPVTANRFRLAKLDRLNAVLDKMDTADPARPYVAAEARKRSAWYAATTAVRLSVMQIGLLIFCLWLTVHAVKSLIWPNPLFDYPLLPFWWWKVGFLLIQLGGIAAVLRRRRLERVNFYNVLIEAGPSEFAAVLRKRAFVPLLSWTERPPSLAPSLKRPDATRAGHLLEHEGILTCPNGHPVSGRGLFITEFDPKLKPPRKFLCARCLKPLPTPLTRDLDKLERDLEARLEVRGREQAKREAKNKPTDGNPTTISAGSDVAEDIEATARTGASPTTG